MTQSDLHRHILSIFSDVFQTNLDADLDDIYRNELEAWDSINHFRLISEIEQAFEVTLDDEEVASVASLKDIKTLLNRRGINSYTSR